MKLSKFAVIAGIVAGLGLQQAAQAVPINGTISFTGGSGSISTVGGVSTVDFLAGDFFNVNSGLGDYTGAVGGATDFKDISYVGTGPAAILTSSNSPEWSFTIGGLTYTYNLTALTNATFTNGATSSLTINGTGIATITGGSSSFEPTLASFSLQGTGNGVNFVIFQASDTAVGQRVPDGGAAVALLGLALVGVEGLRRKLLA